MAEVARQARQWTLFAAEYPKRAGDDTELACYALQWQRMRDGDASARRTRGRSGSAGRSSPNRVSPCLRRCARKASSHRTTSGRVSGRRTKRAISGSRRGCSTSCRQPSGPAPRDSTASSAIPRRRSPRAIFAGRRASGRELALYALDRVARSDADGGARRVGAMALARARARPPLRQSARRVQRGAPVAAVGECLVSRSRRRVAQRAAARVARARGAARARLGRRRARDRRDAGSAGAGARVALLEGARARGARAERRCDPAVRRPCHRASFLRISRRRGARRGGHAGERASAVDAAALAAFGARDDVQARHPLLPRSICAPKRSANGCMSCAALDDDALAARRRGRAPQRPVRPVDQHRRPHAAAARFLACATRRRTETEIDAAARDNRIDEALAFGLARQESRFVADIMSSAGAVGLMQLMPRDGALGRATDSVAPTIASRSSISPSSMRNGHVLSSPCSRSARRHAGARDRGV